MLMRVYRDDVLAETKAGRNLLSMLYDNSAEILALLLQDSSLIRRVREMTAEILPEIESRLYYNNVIEMNMETVKEFEDILNEFDKKGSRKLKSAIRGIRGYIQNKELLIRFGIEIIE